MKKENRAYISIFFKDGASDKRKKGYLTICFNKDDTLYAKCKKLGSSKIKEMLGINSYNELINKAQEEDRSLGNYVKYKIRKKLIKNE
jgi:hypothetical protein